MSFGKLLREARLDKGLTQRQLADLIHAKHNSISNWENDQNRPDPDTIEYLCGILEVSASYFFPDASKTPAVSPREWNVIKKYRVLKDHGKKIVDIVLEEEYQHYLATQQNVVPYAAMGGGGVITKDQAERDLCVIDNDTKDLED